MWTKMAAWENLDFVFGDHKNHPTFTITDRQVQVCRCLTSLAAGSLGGGLTGLPLGTVVSLTRSDMMSTWQNIFASNNSAHLTAAVEGMKVTTALGVGSSPCTSSLPSSVTGMEASFRCGTYRWYSRALPVVSRLGDGIGFRKIE